MAKPQVAYTTCPECSSIDIIENAMLASIYCADCGHEFECGMIRESVSFGAQGSVPTGQVVSRFDEGISRTYQGSNGYRRSLRDAREQRKAQIYRQVEQFQTKLKMPKTYIDHVKELLTRVYDKEKKGWSLGLLGDMRIGAAYYAVCRMHSKPRTLMEIAMSVGCNVFKLGGIYQKIRQKSGIGYEEVDPVVYIAGIASELGLSNTTEMEVCALSLRLINLAKRDWITTGRRPITIAGAAVQVACEILKIKLDTEQKRKIMLHVKSGSTTIKERYKEIIGCLVSRGKDMPWEVDEKNATRHALDILKIAELIEEGKPDKPPKKKRKRVTSMFDSVVSSKTGKKQKLTSADDALSDDTDSEIEVAPTSAKPVPLFKPQKPPSIKRAEVGRIRRKEMIKCAKTRIASMKEIGTDQPANARETASEVERILGEEDILVEKLLLRGVPEDSIIGGNYKVPEEPLKVIDLDSPIISEADMPDEEVNLYLRSKKEIKAMQILRQTKV